MIWQAMNQGNNNEVAKMKNIYKNVINLLYWIYSVFL